MAGLPAFLRTVTVAVVVTALGACTTTSRPRPPNYAQQARDAQRQLLSGVGLLDVFKQPVVNGQTTVIASSEARAGVLVISFDPRYVPDAEIDEAGRVYCEKQNRQPMFLNKNVGQPDQSSRVARERIQNVGSAEIFCSNGSAADQARLAEYQGYKAAAAREEAERQAMLRAAQTQAMGETLRANRESWQAIRKRDEQRALGAAP